MTEQRAARFMVLTVLLAAAYLALSAHAIDTGRAIVVFSPLHLLGSSVR